MYLCIYLLICTVGKKTFQHFQHFQHFWLFEHLQQFEHFGIFDTFLELCQHVFTFVSFEHFVLFKVHQHMFQDILFCNISLTGPSVFRFGIFSGLLPVNFPVIVFHFLYFPENVQPIREIQII